MPRLTPLFLMFLLAGPLAAQSSDSTLVQKLAKAKADYEVDAASPDNLIWYGRRLAYLGRYREAIAVFSEGIGKHPNDARMYRHRGHRYITLREFDNAIRDLEKAAALVEGEPDEVEPDGAPNKHNIPVGTLHHNIYYHLALAHYLKHDFTRALPVWQKTLAVSANDDAIVSAADWLYMTLRRLGRTAEAQQVLAPIRKDMKILENDTYHQRLLMYKGEATPESLLGANADAVQVATFGYGVANWYLYNGERDKAFTLFKRILDGTGWAAFGYIAAERDVMAMPPSQPIDVARNYRIAHEAEIINDYARLLAIPNVDGDSANIHANARFISAAFAQAGVKLVLWQRPGASPLLYGELRAPGATRTIGLYAHYDGQPVNAAEWSTPAWQPTLFTRARESGGVATAFPKTGERVDAEMRLYARSAGDDKAPIQALLTVLRAGIKPTVNITFLFDGEEENGSPNLRKYVDEHRAQLNDIEGWLFLDGPVHQSRNPLISFGARGITELEITVYGAARGLHSGHYGNWAPNPALLLAQLLAKMKDEEGRVVIPGFYDSTAPIGRDERAALDALPDYDVALKRELGLVKPDGSGKPLPEMLLQPSLNIRGFTSGSTGAQASNVIPPVATASLDVRLVKGNEPAKMLDLVEGFVRAQGYHVVREDPDMATRLAHARIAKIVRGTETPAAQSSMSEPLARDVLAAMRALSGDRLLVFPTMGGTLPLHIFTDYLKQPAIVVPIVNHDNRQHAADENLRIANLWYGIELFAAVLTMQGKPTF